MEVRRIGGELVENWWRIGGELVENWWNLNLNLVEFELESGRRIWWKCSLESQKNLVEELVKRGSVEYSLRRWH